MAYITKKHTEITGININLSVDEVNVLIGALYDSQITLEKDIEVAEEGYDIDFLNNRKNEVDELLSVLESIWSGQDCQ
jgi:hypothetical protein